MELIVNNSRNRTINPVLILIFIIGVALSNMPAMAAEPHIVRAVLFYSPSCPACHEVINQFLPPLIEQYPEQLQIIGIDVTQQTGNELYQAALISFEIPDERIGVPTLIVGENVLVGRLEIPDMLPGIIEHGLSSGGIGWPAIPGLDQALAQAGLDPEDTEIESTDSGLGSDLTVIDKFMLDPIANTISVIVLIGMLFSVVAVGHRFLTNKSAKREWPNWALPVLTIIGLGIALYMTYVEMTHNQAVCGPVGNCNTVQESQYAYLFGILPVGLMGVIGYIAIIAAWIIYRFGPDTTRKISIIAIWGMAWFGVLFSIYLTFLEPFVIGASCAWCLSSAIVMTLILWASTGPALESMQIKYLDDEAGEEDYLEDNEDNEDEDIEFDIAKKNSGEQTNSVPPA